MIIVCMHETIWTICIFMRSNSAVWQEKESAIKPVKNTAAKQRKKQCPESKRNEDDSAESGKSINNNSQSHRLPRARPTKEGRICYFFVLLGLEVKPQPLAELPPSTKNGGGGWVSRVNPTRYMIDQKRIRPALPFWSSSRLWVEESKRTLEVAAATEGSDNVKSTGMANENYMPQYIQLLHSLGQFKMHNTVLLYTQSTIVSSTSQLSTFNMASHHQLHQLQQNCNSSNSYIKATTFLCQPRLLQYLQTGATAIEDKQLKHQQVGM